MGNGDMSDTRGVVREKARVARDLIKSHPLTPELSAELFAQKGISAFLLVGGSAKNLGTSV